MAQIENVQQTPSTVQCGDLFIDQDTNLIYILGRVEDGLYNFVNLQDGGRLIASGFILKAVDNVAKQGNLRRLAHGSTVTLKQR